MVKLLMVVVVLGLTVALQRPQGYDYWRERLRKSRAILSGVLAIACRFSRDRPYATRKTLKLEAAGHLSPTLVQVTGRE